MMRSKQLRIFAFILIKHRCKNPLLRMNVELGQNVLFPYKNNNWC